jgi:NAD-dependent dihydropyrimidine dehydrogenase PreA subunit
VVRAAGAISGGSHNAAWAIASGTWAGTGAARFAARRAVPGSGTAARAAGGTGLRPTGAASADDVDDIVRTVQAHVFPLDRNYFRTGTGGRDGMPVIARQSQCQTCFMCEAYCPADALFVAPLSEPAPVESIPRRGCAGGGGCAWRVPAVHRLGTRPHTRQRAGR